MDKTEKIFDRVNLPSDIKELSIEELETLAAELREIIINTVASTGGHLAPSLGVVELILSLHYVFDTPQDKLVFDVGHQSYAHMLLTGRKKDFHSLRTIDGLSGFPKREKSNYDTFNTGHASTSISASLGIAIAKALKKEDAKVITIIGDGSLTGGLAYEGLNQAGDLKPNMIVIINDNEMSIAPNVGAISMYLNKIITGQFYNRIRNDIERILKKSPIIGQPMFKIMKLMEEMVKGFITPGILFEELGFRYVGPIRGNNLDDLIKTFKNVKTLEGPTVVHIVTRKGKGYKPAELKPENFHGTGPFDVKTGEPTMKGKGPLTYGSVFGKTLVKLAQDDNRIIAITAAMKENTGLLEFSEKFPNKFFDVGIAEQHAVVFAGGLATEGYKPVVAIYSTFMQRAYDQVVHDVCLQNLDVTFVMDRAGIVGEDGETHQGLFDISYLRHIPNIVIMSPKDENELQHMLKTAIEHPGPATIRYPKGKSEGIKLDDTIHTLELGKSEIIKDGNDLAIFAIGPLVNSCYDAVELLAKDGLSAALINSRFIKPLDITTIIDYARKTKKILTVEENVLLGGFGSAILEVLSDNNINNIKVIRLGIADHFVTHGNRGLMRQRYGLDTDGIYKSAKNLILDNILNIDDKRSNKKAGI
jgi:1-deoxy-D-xylulose-5-phosphate synthase